jgi:hypothetical protein
MRILPRWSAVLLFLSTLPAISAAAQNLGSGIAFARAQHQQHGINAAWAWFEHQDVLPQSLSSGAPRSHP